MTLSPLDNQGYLYFQGKFIKTLILSAALLLISCNLTFTDSIGCGYLFIWGKGHDYSAYHTHAVKISFQILIF